jgi:DNA-binding Lrp family transcriptional regulator
MSKKDPPAKKSPALVNDFLAFIAKARTSPEVHAWWRDRGMSYTGTVAQSILRQLVEDNKLFIYKEANGQAIFSSAAPATAATAATASTAPSAPPAPPVPPAPTPAAVPVAAPAVPAETKGPRKKNAPFLYECRRLLSILQHTPNGLTNAQLAERLGYKENTVSVLTRRMCRAGYIRRAGPAGSSRYVVGHTPLPASRAEAVKAANAINTAKAAEVVKVVRTSTPTEAVTPTTSQPQPPSKPATTPQPPSLIAILLTSLADLPSVLQSLQCVNVTLAENKQGT